jgi:hypothetical protein
LIAKELDETVAFKCDPSVRNRLISKELKRKFALKCEVSEKAPLASVRGKKELEEVEKTQADAWAASRRCIRDAKAALRRG